MRLKATIENVITFSRIVQSIEKQSKACVMRFSPTTLQIICAGESEGGVQADKSRKQPEDCDGTQHAPNAVDRKETLFKDFIIQSNSENEITCELQTEALLSALKSASASPDITMKLAKRDNVAVFCFEMQVQSRQGKKMDITHDVRVKIMKLSEVLALKEPLCPEPDIHIILPPLAKIRTVVERMAKLSPIIGFSAQADGNLKVEIATDSVAVETIWQNCPLPQIAGDGEDANQDGKNKDAEREEKPFHAVLLSMRSLLRFLSSYVVSTTTIACICAGHCLIMYVYIGEMDDSGGVLTFYIPSRMDEVAD
ncbi:hypothetical protein FRB96_003377 [Tulasnella sp. 330]|nr:hypothetical protein FRB96_003377 [Tulasnella sp. 330]KAG8887454.1 hypothetical protein FRB98_009598 [Tulasnella sp. 332]